MAQKKKKTSNRDKIVIPLWKSNLSNKETAAKI